MPALAWAPPSGPVFCAGSVQGGRKRIVPFFHVISTEDRDRGVEEYSIFTVFVILLGARVDLSSDRRLPMSYRILRSIPRRVYGMGYVFHSLLYFIPDTITIHNRRSFNLFCGELTTRLYFSRPVHLSERGIGLSI